jgi:hypothetical protein
LHWRSWPRLYLKTRMRRKITIVPSGDKKERRNETPEGHQRCPRINSSVKNQAIPMGISHHFMC